MKFFRKALKIISIQVLFTMLFEIGFPIIAKALTSGPSQPEMTSFEPAGTSDMVDLSSGAFHYDIPLLTIDGYPISLSYHSGVSMDQEASWVGLGWNINPGAINRGMRGIPDDFNGDTMKRQMHIIPNVTIGGNIGAGAELFGLSNIGLGLGMSLNNYTGTAMDMSLNIVPKIPGPISAGIGLDFSSQNGLEVSPHIGLGCVLDDQSKFDLGVSVGASFNSRQGMKNLTVGASSSLPFSQVNAHFPIGTPTYVPEYSLPMANIGATYNANVGLAFNGLEPNVRIEGYSTKEALAADSLSIPAVGYMYAENDQNASNLIQDFNRERDQSFYPSMQRLPVLNQSYDIYSISGEGISGIIRPHRSDVGIVCDNQVTSNSSNNNDGVEVGFADFIHAGVNLGSTHSNMSSGKWTAGSASAVTSILNFKGDNNISNPVYEPCYFKMAGELTTGDQTVYNQFNNTSAARINLTGSASNIFAAGSLYSSDHSTTIALSSANSYLHSRDKRNYCIRALNALDASYVGFETTIKSYPSNYWTTVKSGGTPFYLPRMDPDASVHKKQHISEITVTKPDGSRYVYGVPVYNLYQKDATFAVANQSVNKGTTSYYVNTVSGVNKGDNSVYNKQKYSGYYSSNALPPFAHTYLLTSVLSPDYQDLKHDGVTDDDYGSYTKFNYTRMYYKGGKQYRWRVPYKSGIANYNEGLKTKTNDQTASYTYGTKEIWYLQSVESKNYVAEFVISKRHDGYGVLGENGGLDTSMSMYKLDSIKLYAKHDRIQYGNSAIPLKIVTFEYDYELCPDVENNDFVPQTVGGVNINYNRGKLTLKKVYFINGNSTKGRLTPYQFQYADPTHNTSDPSKNDTTNSYNPHYNITQYDRWGNYKNDAGNTVKNWEFPYTDQDSVKANTDANAWCLTTIILPSGGLVKIDYQSNDYAYVQNQRAMEMFNVIATASNQTGTIVDDPFGTLYSRNPGNNVNNYNNFLYFKVALPHTETNINTFKAHYLSGIHELYFKCLVNLNLICSSKEYVSGYVVLDSNNCAMDATHNYAYIKYLSDGLQDNSGGPQCNPVSKAGWQYTRMNINSLIFPGPDPSTGFSSLDQAVKGLAGVFNVDIPIMVEGYNKFCRAGSFSASINPLSSWIRLRNPTFKKYGGGTRVKQLSMTDAWSSMVSGASASTYGQTYDYRVYTPGNGWISSGVASYEPMIGNDENPFRLPIPYTETFVACTSLELYQEGPYGESFFPAPTIVYSTVKVTNIKPSTSIKRTGTGYTVYEFYTSKDFPVILDQTSIDAHPYQPVSIETLLGVNTTVNETVSQGYSIEVNDMAGKEKAVWQYAENQPEFSQGLSRVSTALSGVEYVYKTSTVNPALLDNNVTVIDSAGHMLTKQYPLGVDFDCVADLRESSTNTQSQTNEINVDLIGFPFLIPVPMWLPNSTSYSSTFRSTVMTKVVTRTGILVTTIYHDNGQSTKSVNEAWDKETGNVLLQKTYNEFGDSIYTFTYPAHWMTQYAGMSQSSINEGVRLQKVSFDSHGAMSSTANSYTVSNYLIPGDMVLLYLQQGNDDIPCYYQPLWVYYSHSKYFLIDVTGQIFTPISQLNIYNLKVIRSGHKNMAGTPVGKLVSRNLLYQYNRLHYTNILDASAVSFSQNWQTYCCGFQPWYDGSIYQSEESICSVINPYTRNILGEWRPLCNYAFLGNRTSTTSQIIQQEGNYSNFTPFWSYDSISSQWTAATNSKQWQWATQVTKVSPFGFQLETKDTLGRYNSSVYGYNNSLNTAVASNAKYQQIGYDGFEDNGYAKLTPDGINPDYPQAITQYPPHFGFFSPFANSIGFLSKDTSHTGTYSIRVNPGQKDSFSRAVNIISTSTPTDTAYRLKLNDCLGYFSPNDSGKYVVGAWVMVKGWQDSASYTNPSIKVTVQKTGKPNAITTLKASGNIIEGWQRIEGTFYMPNGAKNIVISFNADPSQNTYFDDLRLFPFNASMKSFVYDPIDLRLKATLDENNYATFYEYDEEGNIIRIKKETAEGIRTVQETRKHIQQ